MKLFFRTWLAFALCLCSLPALSNEGPSNEENPIFSYTCEGYEALVEALPRESFGDYYLYMVDCETNEVSAEYHKDELLSDVTLIFQVKALKGDSEYLAHLLETAEGLPAMRDMLLMHMEGLGEVDRGLFQVCTEVAGMTDAVPEPQPVIANTAIGEMCVMSSDGTRLDRRWEAFVLSNDDLRYAIFYDGSVKNDFSGSDEAASALAPLFKMFGRPGAVSAKAK